MLVRPIRFDEKEAFNAIVNHPLQSWEWGEFKEKNGQKVERIGFYNDGELEHGLQVFFHETPVIHKPVGYCPKGFTPDEDQLGALKQIGSKKDALFIKLEPNTLFPVEDEPKPIPKGIATVLQQHDTRPGRQLFTKNTFVLDLTKDEETLFSDLESKTRYNVNLASRKGVKVYENSTDEGLQEHLKILKATTSRQGFYAHNEKYFQQMWDTLKESGMMRIFEAHYKNKVLVSWIMFIFNGVLYYPYGASIREHRNVMASNLMMWEMIRFGQSQNCTAFDMWGSLGPDADKSNPWYGFHRFKRGYSGQLMQSIGTHDLVINKQMYPLFRVADNLRWKYLRLKKKLPF